MKLDEAIERGVTEPLGMGDTSFRMTGAQRANCTPCICRVRTEAGRHPKSICAKTPSTGPAATGLHSTPRDYMKFQRTLLGNGTSPDGVTILKPTTVDAAGC